MLREDVVQAVADGQFHIYPVRTVDEGIAILTGVEAGERGEDGKFPKETVNRLVDDGLRKLAKRLKTFGRPPKKKGDEEAPVEENGEESDEDETPEVPGEPGLPGDTIDGIGDDPEQPEGGPEPPEDLED